MGPSNIKLNPIGLIGLIALGLFATMYVLGVDFKLDFLRSEKEVSMKELLSASIDLAVRGGLEVKAVADSADFQQYVKSKTREGANEFVTNGDRNSHSKIIYGFNKAFPELMSKIISEEKDTKPVDLHQVPEPNKNLPEVVKRFPKDDQKVRVSDLAIWIDPLDATQEYTESLNQYVTTMICVAVRGQPTIGVIHFPFSKTTVWGWFGYGSNVITTEGTNTEDKKETPLKVIVSRSHKGDSEPYIQEALGKTTEVIPAGGAGYKTLQVANGTVDAYVHFTKIKKWDICAGNAILITVNGKMTTLEGRAIDYSLAGDVEMNEGLLATIKDHEQYKSKLHPAFVKFKEDKQRKKEKDAKKSAAL